MFESGWNILQLCDCFLLDPSVLDILYPRWGSSPQVDLVAGDVEQLIVPNALSDTSLVADSN